MQIKFTPKKLKEAKEYVHLLKNPNVQERKESESKKEISLVRKLFNLLFK